MSNLDTTLIVLTAFIIYLTKVQAFTNSLEYFVFRYDNTLFKNLADLGKRDSWRSRRGMNYTSESAFTKSHKQSA